MSTQSKHSIHNEVRRSLRISSQKRMNYKTGQKIAEGEGKNLTSVMETASVDGADDEGTLSDDQSLENVEGIRDAGERNTSKLVLLENQQLYEDNHQEHDSSLSSVSASESMEEEDGLWGNSKRLIDPKRQWMCDLPPIVVAIFLHTVYEPFRDENEVDTNAVWWADARLNARNAMTQRVLDGVKRGNRINHNRCEVAWYEVNRIDGFPLSNIFDLAKTVSDVKGKCLSQETLSRLHGFVEFLERELCPNKASLLNCVDEKGIESLLTYMADIFDTSFNGVIGMNEVRRLLVVVKSYVRQNTGCEKVRHIEDLPDLVQLQLILQSCLDLRASIVDGQHRHLFVIANYIQNTKFKEYESTTMATWKSAEACVQSAKWSRSNSFLKTLGKISYSMIEVSVMQNTAEYTQAALDYRAYEQLSKSREQPLGHDAILNYALIELQRVAESEWSSGLRLLKEYSTLGVKCKRGPNDPENEIRHRVLEFLVERRRRILKVLKADGGDIRILGAEDGKKMDSQTGKQKKLSFYYMLPIGGKVAIKKSLASTIRIKQPSQELYILLLLDMTCHTTNDARWIINWLRITKGNNLDMIWEDDTILQIVKCISWTACLFDTWFVEWQGTSDKNEQARELNAKRRRFSFVSTKYASWLILRLIQAHGLRFNITVQPSARGMLRSEEQCSVDFTNLLSAFIQAMARQENKKVRKRVEADSIGVLIRQFEQQDPEFYVQDYETFDHKKNLYNSEPFWACISCIKNDDKQVHGITRKYVPFENRLTMVFECSRASKKNQDDVDATIDLTNEEPLPQFPFRRFGSSKVRKPIIERHNPSREARKKAAPIIETIGISPRKNPTRAAKGTKRSMYHDEESDTPPSKKKSPPSFASRTDLHSLCPEEGGKNQFKKLVLKIRGVLRKMQDSEPLGNLVMTKEFVEFALVQQEDVAIEPLVLERIKLRLGAKLREEGMGHLLGIVNATLPPLPSSAALSVMDIPSIALGHPDGGVADLDSDLVMAYVNEIDVAQDDSYKIEGMPAAIGASKPWYRSVLVLSSLLSKIDGLSNIFDTKKMQNADSRYKMVINNVHEWVNSTSTQNGNMNNNDNDYENMLPADLYLHMCSAGLFRRFAKQFIMRIDVDAGVNSMHEVLCQQQGSVHQLGLLFVNLLHDDATCNFFHCALYRTSMRLCGFVTRSGELAYRDSSEEHFTLYSRGKLSLRIGKMLASIFLVDATSLVYLKSKEHPEESDDDGDENRLIVQACVSVFSLMILFEELYIIPNKYHWCCMSSTGTGDDHWCAFSQCLGKIGIHPLVATGLIGSPRMLNATTTFLGRMVVEGVTSSGMTPSNLRVVAIFLSRKKWDSKVSTIRHDLGTIVSALSWGAVPSTRLDMVSKSIIEARCSSDKDIISRYYQ